MIENYVQFKTTRSQIKILQKAQAELQAAIKRQPESIQQDKDFMIIRKAENDALQSLIDELQEEVDNYIKSQFPNPV